MNTREVSMLKITLRKEEGQYVPALIGYGALIELAPSDEKIFEPAIVQIPVQEIKDRGRELSIYDALDIVAMYSSLGRQAAAYKRALEEGKDIGLDQADPKWLLIWSRIIGLKANVNSSTARALWKTLREIEAAIKLERRLNHSSEHRGRNVRPRVRSHRSHAKA